MSRVDEDRAFNAAAELRAIGLLNTLALGLGIDPDDLRDLGGVSEAGVRRVLEAMREVWDARGAYEHEAITVRPEPGDSYPE